MEPVEKKNLHGSILTSLNTQMKKNSVEGVRNTRRVEKNPNPNRICRFARTFPATQFIDTPDTVHALGQSLQWLFLQHQYVLSTGAAAVLPAVAVTSVK